MSEKRLGCMQTVGEPLLVCRRLSDELQPRQAGALLDAQDRNGAQTASEESIKSRDLKDTSSLPGTGSLYSAEIADKASLHSK